MLPNVSDLFIWQKQALPSDRRQLEAYSHPNHEIIAVGAEKLLDQVLLPRAALALTSEGDAETLQGRRPLQRLEDVKHIIVIYQENWSFDSLYGRFPGANGYANGFDTLPQFDVKADPPYSALIYQTPSPLTGSPLAPDPNFPSVGGKLALASDHTLAARLLLTQQLALLKELAVRIHEDEQTLEGLVQESPALNYVRSLPGMGPILAAVISCERRGENREDRPV